MSENKKPYGGKDFFGINDVEKFRFNPDEPLFGRAPTVSESQKPYEDFSSRSSRSVDIGALNAVDGTTKQKFVVHIDDSDDTAEIGKASRGVNRGGIYFTDSHSPRFSREQNVSAEAKSHPDAIPISGGRKRVTHPSDAPKESPVEHPNMSGSPKSEGKFVLSFVAVIVAISLIVSLLGISCVNDVLAINRNEDSVVVTIPNNANANDIIDILAENNLVHQKLFCKLFYRLKNSVFNKPSGMGYLSAFLSNSVNEEPVFLSGVYYVDSDMGLEGYLNEFQEEQVAEKTINVFFQEGWTFFQMIDKLDNFGVCKKAELIAAMEGANYDFDFIADLPGGQDRVFRLEGYLFPDTYEFFETCDANTIIRKMLSNFESKWTDEYAARAEELDMTMDEVITLASIIQREAANAEQMPVVSSVLHNRLNHSVSYPTLGCDSTKNYIEKYVIENVTTVKAQEFLRSYDTSAIQGLPAGPICNPGVDAIEAALYPEDSDYYYFCHDNSGTIYLAKTNEEHDRNMLQVLRKNNG